MAKEVKNEYFELSCESLQGPHGTCSLSKGDNYSLFPYSCTENKQLLSS